jgi:hypothetical protein
MGRVLSLLVLLTGCTTAAEPPTSDDSPPGETAPQASTGAEVQAVSATGEDGAWVLSVTLLSPDVDCSRYADWWELLDPDGTLVYRRILNHSHADEQPFTRAGDPVDLTAERELLVRGHMNDSGYGGAVFRGTVSDGFAADPSVGADFAAELSTMEPLPTECWW